MGAFDSTKRMLSSKYGEQYRGELSDSLKGFIEDMQKLNDEKRAAKLLQTPLILFMSVLICWIAISILGESFHRRVRHTLLHPKQNCGTS